MIDYKFMTNTRRINMDRVEKIERSQSTSFDILRFVQLENSYPDVRASVSRVPSGNLGLWQRPGNAEGIPR